MRNMQLTRAREQQGWNYQEVADRIGVSARHVRLWEMGFETISPRNQHKLCNLFHLDMDALFPSQKPNQIKRKRENRNSSSSIINVPDRTGGRARKERRGS